MVKVERVKDTTKEDKPVFSRPKEKIYEIKDDLGRKIEMRWPSQRAENYYPTLFSAQEAENAAFMTSVRPYVFVKSIDGNEVDMFLNKNDLDALMDILGREGKAAIDVGYLRWFAQEEVKIQQTLGDEVKKWR